LSTLSVAFLSEAFQKPLQDLCPLPPFVSIPPGRFSGTPVGYYTGLLTHLLAHVSLLVARDICIIQLLAQNMVSNMCLTQEY
jgi:hypothetical protein